MSRENRRDPRVEVTLPVFIQDAAGEKHFNTKDISYRGIFIMTREPFPLRKLVRFRMEAPDGDYQMMGLVAHRMNELDAAEFGRDPGMGIQLYSVGKLTRERWRDFVLDNYNADPEARAELERKRMPRIRIHLKNDKMKQQFMMRDFPSGGIFYRTNDLQPVGTRMICDVIHPTSGRVFELNATVSETIDGSRRKRGLQLTFDELSEASNHDLERFDLGETSEVEL